MGGIEQRAAARVDCDIPVAIHSDGRKVAASILDASRTGLRMRIPARELGVHRLSSLVQIAQRMSDTFGDSFEVEFLPDRLGGLVKRKLRPVRIGQRDWEHADVEVGCLLADPLNDDEASMLGIALPKPGEAAPGAPLVVEEPVTHAPTQKTSLQAYIQAGNGRGTAPLPTTAPSASAVVASRCGEGAVIVGSADRSSPATAAGMSTSPSREPTTTSPASATI